MPEGTDLAALEELATRVAVAAGRLVVDERPRLVEASATKSSPTDIVTIMDTRAEELIRGLLLAERPADGFLGEEGNDHRGTSGITWVVDPIDGTVNYLYDIPAYAVSVAAVAGDPKTPGEWQVLAGAVADPALRRVYHGALGGGAYERGWDEPAQTRGRAAAGGLGRRPVGSAGRHRLRVHAPAPDRAGPHPARAAAAGARHPPDRQRRPRPLLGGRAAGSTGSTSPA